MATVPPKDGEGGARQRAMHNNDIISVMRAYLKHDEWPSMNILEGKLLGSSWLPRAKEDTHKRKIAMARRRVECASDATRRKKMRKLAEARANKVHAETRAWNGFERKTVIDLGGLVERWGMKKGTQWIKGTFEAAFIRAHDLFWGDDEEDQRVGETVLIKVFTALWRKGVLWWNEGVKVHPNVQKAMATLWEHLCTFLDSNEEMDNDEDVDAEVRIMGLRVNQWKNRLRRECIALAALDAKNPPLPYPEKVWIGRARATYTSPDPNVVFYALQVHPMDMWTEMCHCRQLARLGATNFLVRVLVTRSYTIREEWRNLPYDFTTMVEAAVAAATDPIGTNARTCGVLIALANVCPFVCTDALRCGPIEHVSVDALTLMVQYAPDTPSFPWGEVFMHLLNDNWVYSRNDLQAIARLMLHRALNGHNPQCVLNAARTDDIVGKLFVVRALLRRGLWELVVLLLDAGLDLRGDPPVVGMMAALSDGAIVLLTHAMKALGIERHHVNALPPDINGGNVLHSATKEAVVVWALAHGADRTFKDLMGRTPLQHHKINFRACDDTNPRKQEIAVIIARLSE